MKLFDVNQANIETRCENCDGAIPPKTKKVRYRKFLGVNSVNGSICRRCFIQLAQKILGHATTYGDRILYVIVEDDAQEMAKQIIGRKLTDDELYSVQKGLEWGLSDYTISLRTAIEEAVREE